MESSNSFFVWLLLCSIAFFLRSTYIVVCINRSLIFITNIPLNIYKYVYFVIYNTVKLFSGMILYLYLYLQSPKLFIHLSVIENLGSFQFLAFTNKTMNIHVQVFIYVDKCFHLS